MGLFLAVAAVRSESTSEIVQAISQCMQSYDVKHEVLPGSTPLNDATDAQVFAPVNGWTVVLWPNYFNIHDFPVAKSIASAQPWLISAVHVYDGDYWEHLAVIGATELHSYCSRPTYWQDEPAELERVANFNPAPERLADAANVPLASLAPYLVDADYPDPPENPASIVRLSKWFAKRLPQA